MVFFRKACFENKDKSNALMDRKLVVINIAFFNFYLFSI